MAEGYQRILTREQIKARMLRDASILWGKKGAPMDGYDPLVNMIIEACAAEAKRIHDDIHMSQARMLSRMAQMLTPEVSKGPHPAHAVAHSRPLDPIFKVHPDTLFYFNKKTENNTEDIYFSPIQSFRLQDVAVVCQASGNRMELCNQMQKEVIIQAIGMQRIQTRTLYVGLEINPEIEELRELGFFFDWQTEDANEKNNCLKLLPAANWYLNGKKLNVRPGYPELLQERSNNPLDEYNISSKAQHHALEIYKRNFVTITDTISVKDLEALVQIPKDLKRVFSEEEIAAFPENIVWLQIDFPESFPIQAIEKTFVQLNCFPVLNRRLNKISYRVQQFVNIVPLESNQYFFAVEDVQTQGGESFFPHHSPEPDREKTKTWALRMGGVARFDSRDANAMLNYMLDLIRDEAASFSAIGYDVLASDIKSLLQIVSRLKRKILAKPDQRESIPYLLINTNRTGENIEVFFWSTNGMSGSEVPTGTALISYNQGANFKRNSTYLVSRSFGGRDPLNDQESLFAYREALMTRGRVVTREDLRTICFSWLGNDLKEVEIVNGYKMGDTHLQGIIRTIDVWLTPAEGHILSREDCMDLETRLQNQSSGIIPIRVFREQEDRDLVHYH